MVVWKRMVAMLIGFNACPQLMELFRKDWELWPCWKECVTRKGFEVSKTQSVSSVAFSASSCELSDVSSQ